MEVESQKFSAVMSVFSGDLVDPFNQAVDSLLVQTCPPDEIIIVADGPLGPELRKFLDKISMNCLIRIIKLKINVGPGTAKHHAVLSSRNSLIAVMDADDISSPKRFERQLEEFLVKDIDVIGGLIEEFERSPGDLGIVRSVPLGMDNILKFTKRRNPTNHVTLMFKKEMYLMAGGYPSKRHSEDWDLIIRMLSVGAIIDNIPEVFVQVRAGAKMLSKRKKFRNAKDQINTFVTIYRLGFINSYYLVTNIFISIISVLMPKIGLSLIYRLFLRNKKNN